MHRASALLVAALAFDPAQTTAPRDAQPTTAGTASISVVVLNDEATARPVRFALVSLADTRDGVTMTGLTDDDGRYVFETLPPGRYTLSASKAGYVRMAYGARRYDRTGTLITVLAGQRSADNVIRLPRGGVISGVIFSNEIQPAPNASVSLLVSQLQYGEHLLVPASAAVAAGAVVSTQTDDQGEYRLYGLPEGDYAVVAGAQGSSYSRVFYPGTTERATAGLIHVVAGAEQSGIDIRWQQTPTATVEGTVTGNVPFRQDVRLKMFAAGGAVYVASAGSDGHFAFTSVAPGRYVIQARSSAGAAWGQADVQVDGNDLANVAVSLQPSISISGEVVVDDSSKATEAALDVNLTLSPPYPWQQDPQIVARVLNDRRFVVSGVLPGKYHVVASLKPGLSRDFVVESVAVDGRDVLDRPLDVVPEATSLAATAIVTTETQEISGVVSGENGRAMGDLVLVVFPADVAMWQASSRRIRTTKVATDGIFRIANLPAGEYRIATVADGLFEEKDGPALLQSLVSTSTRFSLLSGEKKRMDFATAQNPK